MTEYFLNFLETFSEAFYPLTLILEEFLYHACVAKMENLFYFIISVQLFLLSNADSHNTNGNSWANGVVPSECAPGSYRKVNLNTQNLIEIYCLHLLKQMWPIGSSRYSHNSSYKAFGSLQIEITVH